LPDVLVKGGDYKINQVVWYKEIVDNWGKVVIIPTVEWYSTTNIVNKLKEV
jgi:D-beta-D-heptose 7-phosphate kinase/D-beta-D-heptose 1-phosphate adenosyltransferase